MEDETRSELFIGFIKNAYNGGRVDAIDTIEAAMTKTLLHPDMSEEFLPGFELALEMVRTTKSALGLVDEEEDPI